MPLRNKYPNHHNVIPITCIGKQIIYKYLVSFAAFLPLTLPFDPGLQSPIQLPWLFLFVLFPPLCPSQLPETVSNNCN